MPPAPIAWPDVDDLYRRRLPMVDVKLGKWQRVGLRNHASVIHFGTGRCYRFDDPKGEFGVLYAGSDYLTCVAESVLRNEIRTGARPLYRSDLEERVIARLAPTDAHLTLVDLTEAVGIGIDNQISTTPDYVLTQAWSRALYEHPSAPDGLYFSSRNFPKGQAIAIFDRAVLRVAITEAASSRIGLCQAPEYKTLLRLLQKNSMKLRR